MDVEDIRSTARDVRCKFKLWKIDEDRLKRLYKKYSNVENIDVFVARAKKIFPKLNCGLTSLFLQDIIGGRIINGKYENRNHTFLLLQKNTIVDITADQYGGPSIYVGPLQKPWSF